MTYKEATARCWLEVDLDAVRANFQEARALLAPGAALIPVLKADAYGLGAAVIGRALYDQGARLFAVATGDEAEALLKAVPEARVLPMGRVGPEQAARLIRRSMPLTLYSAAQGAELSQAARAAGYPARVHVKIDTGLHRLGLDPGEAADVVEALVRGGGIRVEAVYTHLGLHTPEADERQFALLDAACRAMEARGIPVPCVHALDSIGMVRYPRRHLSAVRVGAWLYGVTPRGCAFPEKCRLPARFCARVAQVRSVAAGELVGYDDDHPLARDSRIATLSAGYVDGAARVQPGGVVEIRGGLAPVVGIACMDQMMADVTDLPDCREGDEVCFVGGRIGLDEYAALAGLNRNEALARIGRRAPRVYLEDGRPSLIVREGEETWMR